MRFAFIAKHRHIWPVSWLCEVLKVSRSGFHAWLNRPLSDRAILDAKLVAAIDTSFKASDRTYGARRVWHDVLEEGLICGLHRVERLMRQNALRARPKRRGKPQDEGERSVIADNILDRDFEAERPPGLGLPCAGPDLFRGRRFRRTRCHRANRSVTVPQVADREDRDVRGAGRSQPMRDVQAGGRRSWKWLILLSTEKLGQMSR